MSPSQSLSTATLTEEEKEIIESPECLRMHPIPNKRDNFIWFLCNRIINIIHCLRHSTTAPNFYEKVFPRLDQLH